jgi:hypothetical protein
VDDADDNPIEYNSMDDSPDEVYKKLQVLQHEYNINCKLSRKLYTMSFNVFTRSSSSSKLLCSSQ